MSNSPEELLRFQLKALKMAVMWPIAKGKPVVQLVNRLILIASSVILGVSTVGLLNKALNTSDLVDRSEAMDIFTLTGSALYKMLFFFCNHEDFFEMFSLTSAIIPHVPPDWMTYCTLFSRIHCVLGCVTVSLWGLCPIFKLTFGEITLAGMKLPINVSDPFDSTGLLFCLLYLMCVYGLVLSGQIYMAADCYLFTCIHLANGGLQGISDHLEDMNRQFLHGKAELTEEAHERLKECVELHSKILRFVRKTDELFRSMIFIDVLHAIISLSFAMLQASESKGILENMKMIVFVTYCFIHQYLNSKFGQDLIDQQVNLYHQAVTSVPWPDGSNMFKKTYLLLLTNCQTPVKLSAWSVYQLQYSTFLEFVKSMISYYMVLRSLQDEAVVEI